MPPVLKLWLDYCDKNGVKYCTNNIKGWENNLKNRVTVEQQIAVYKAINSKWKNFYMRPLKESKVHKFLGKSLMMDRDCDTLLDISYKDKKYIYQFKNIRVTSPLLPKEIFAKYGYTKSEVKTAPIAPNIKDRLMGMFQKF